MHLLDSAWPILTKAGPSRTRLSRSSAAERRGSSPVSLAATAHLLGCFD
jgi:hypothetical protein